MPRHFRSLEAYRKAAAFVHIHGVKTHHPKEVIIAGRPHKVSHVGERIGGKLMPMQHRCTLGCRHHSKGIYASVQKSTKHGRTSTLPQHNMATHQILRNGLMERKMLKGY